MDKLWTAGARGLPRSRKEGEEALAARAKILSWKPFPRTSGHVTSFASPQLFHDAQDCRRCIPPLLSVPLAVLETPVHLGLTGNVARVCESGRQSFGMFHGAMEGEEQSLQPTHVMVGVWGAGDLGFPLR